MSERDIEGPLSAWTELTEVEDRELADGFYRGFGFRPGVSPDAWPAIQEPSESLTFDLSVIPDGPQRGAAYDAINAEALRAFVWAMPDVDRLLALDWQHPNYWFAPKEQALKWRGEWEVPVYPDGDYYSFLTPDFTEGTFGHPWEKTICVIGDRLINSLGATLSAWLPVKRRGGENAN